MYPLHFALDAIPHASHEKMSAKINNDNTFSCLFAEPPLRVTRLWCVLLMKRNFDHFTFRSTREDSLRSITHMQIPCATNQTSSLHWPS